MKKLIALLLLLPVFATADPRPWMKKENPNELGFITSVGEACPITNKEVATILQGVLIRSRLKPVILKDSDLGILTEVHCFSEALGAMYAFTIDVDFISKMTVDGWLVPLRYMYRGYGSVGIQDKDGMLQKVKSDVERAITNYLQANFDLGKDE